MNKKAQDLGLKSTHFVTPHGLDEEHYTTAYELALITDYALNIDKIREVVNTKTYTVYINERPKTINNTNELLGSLKGVNGVKTGFTNGAGRCLVTSVNRDGFNIISVVLGADTKKIRTRDSIKLIEYIYSNYEQVNLNELIEREYINWCNINKNRIKIDKSKNNNIKFGLEKYDVEKYPIKNEDIKDIKIEIKNGRLYYEAPVNKDTSVALLRIYLKDEKILDLNIYIENEIKRKTFIDYFKECLTFPFVRNIM